MTGNIIDEWWIRFKSGNIITRLIGINIIVFLLYKLGEIVFWLIGMQHVFNDFIYRQLLLHADYGYTLTHPWTLLTYMFMHIGFFHLLFNLIWLHFFGMMAERIFSYKHIRGLYFLGGILGGLLFILIYNLFPSFALTRSIASLLGASASILAIVMAVTMKQPDVELQLLLIGRIKLKYLALFLIIIDVLFISVENPGGHVAHLGGVVGGWWFVRGLNRGYDMTGWINVICDACVRCYDWITGLRRRQPRMKVHYSETVNTDRKKDYEYNARKKEQNDEIDRILDKLRKSGYASLSDEEKKQLFDASKK